MSKLLLKQELRKLGDQFTRLLQLLEFPFPNKDKELTETMSE